MYIPTAFKEENLDKLVGFMQANSFATLVSTVEGMPFASHVPLVVTIEDQTVKLTGHLAKANPQWQAFAAAESLAIFIGPHAYIDPALYEKQENVPTWNYIAVHAYGKPQLITLDDSPEQMDQMIEGMINAYGPDFKTQWKSLSSQYQEGMMRGIVGFEMAVSRLEGKYKLSQNRSFADQHSVAQALQQNPDPTASAVGEVMQQNLEAS
ncbi:FMN-binding negative transcriptional regulator [Pseudanabaena sp. FACHB-2040]|uniref:FMN-binding negative transcriptional regulator n=1 Tax=Pseudanabaena sp. FACHB-2040 TaxID=2692859 RepID=UPI001683653C|nr:FMN-binding negative transcriptional regulator [Pseudanabaena sp. FACHB-2040]MBD2256829.1 FMN-binding negative transcriptional regulator [Pseudanabaena sp. FACHB-2040]